MPDAAACQVGNETNVKASIIHYVFANVMDQKGNAVPHHAEEAVWSFVKEDYRDRYPQVPYPPPPGQAGEGIKTVAALVSEAAQSADMSAWWRANVLPIP